MELWNHQQYRDMVVRSVERFEKWNKFFNKKIVLSGGTGMILSYLIDVIMQANVQLRQNIEIISIGRNENAFNERFSHWICNQTTLRFVQGDMSHSLSSNELLHNADYIIHGASTTHPKDYAQYPISTIMTNVMGTKNMLDLAGTKKGSRFLLMSSVEVYGDNRNGIAAFTENDCGYINCNTLRAGYPEGKRVSEALCQAYRAERGIETVILRIPRSYGPTLKQSDSKAMTQFLKNCLAGENIVLKSRGEQLFSYAYVADVVHGLLIALTEGEDGEAYNLSDPQSDVRLRDLAEMLANYSGTEVVFDLPDEQEKKGFSAASVALINSDKLRSIGWQADYTMKAGLEETIDILKAVW